MSVNKYMHPRNIYKTPPNFKQLALDYPEFQPFVKQELSGKVTFDFKNNDALRALSYTLLKQDFGLDVHIPSNKLIPTIPLRLNYILWIEDLLGLTETKGRICGIDIGTGASCIYPLLSAKKNKWFMLGTEVDEESLRHAKTNVDQNGLHDFIKIVHVDESIILKGIVKDDEFDFCMCNPPFFGSTQELHPCFKARKLDRPKPKNSFCASIKEVVVKGGEVDFISKLIIESESMGKQVKIYSTMVGHKKNLPMLKLLLRQHNVASFCETEFCQGNTTRWGLAWTYCESVDLKKSPNLTKQLMKQSKPKEPLIYKLSTNQDSLDEYMLKMNDNIVKLFDNLEMAVENISTSQNCYKYIVRAFSNTWSNQRRKKRAMMKEQTKSLNSAGEQDSSTSSVEEIEIDTNVKSPGKRIHEDYLEGNVLKKLKISENAVSAVFFKFITVIQKEQSNISLILNCSADSNRDYLHQILQYVKNHLEN